MGGSSWTAPLPAPRPRELPESAALDPASSAACSNEAEASSEDRILDDYQNVALRIADWSAVAKKADITVSTIISAKPTH